MLLLILVSNSFLFLVAMPGAPTALQTHYANCWDALGK